MTKKPLFQQSPQSSEALDWHHKKLFYPTDYNGYYHWHQGCELLIVFDGAGSVVVNQQMSPIKKGMLFFFQPFQLHHVAPASAAPYERATLHFDPLHAEKRLTAYPAMVQFFRHLKNDYNQDPFIDFSEDYFYIRSLCDMHDKMAEAASINERAEREELLLIQLLSYMQHQLKGRPPTKELRKIHYAERIMGWIEDHLMEPFNLSQLAQDLYLSKSYVSKVFRRETGSSITDYLTARRMKEACHLLQTTSLPIDEISQRIGLTNVSYFIQMFKRKTNATPHQYRLSMNTDNNHV
ncbi:AraC family transcriptional regulator [Shouchella tritolerans]|uniref:AraC family transcriptional regulator n=1 Tax=Shouchella tritolerans TaxID=2979466 RepID=UPI0021E858A6|nr:AraC family transcriptional regulator [Shouchella tritolerans]